MVTQESNHETPKHDQPVVPTIQVEDLDFDINHSTGTAISSRQTQVILWVVEAKTAMPIELTDSIILGRGDTSMSETTYVDLSAYGAVDKGVSRRHAVLQRIRRTITICDLDSQNGTFLNGDRLVAHQPRLLRNGDAIHLAKLLLHIQFE